MASGWGHGGDRPAQKPFHSSIARHYAPGRRLKMHVIASEHDMDVLRGQREVKLKAHVNRRKVFTSSRRPLAARIQWLETVELTASADLHRPFRLSLQSRRSRTMASALVPLRGLELRAREGLPLTLCLKDDSGRMVGKVACLLEDAQLSHARPGRQVKGAVREGRVPLVPFFCRPCRGCLPALGRRGRVAPGAELR